MEREFGGYLPLERNRGTHFFAGVPHAHVYAVNSGRSGIALIARARGIKKLYIPRYLCDTVYLALEENGIAYSFYMLDETLRPLLPQIEEDAWILIVNYFGCLGAAEMEAMHARYGRVIFDHTQGFFANMPTQTNNCWHVFSARKFFGVTDGAYVVCADTEEAIDLSAYPQDRSWPRSMHLLQQIEDGTHAGYKKDLFSEEQIGFAIQRMSPLTSYLLEGLDYTAIRDQRRKNLARLRERLDDCNLLPDALYGEDMMVYPLLTNDATLRARLVSQKIYVPQWWKYVMELVPEDTVEYRFSEKLCALPLDQRYTEDDMDQMADIVRAAL